MANEIINLTGSPQRFRRVANVSVGSVQMATPALDFEGHAATPIKNIEDINLVRNYLIRNRKYRDNLMFIMGINFGLRCSDLVTLRYGDIITPDLTYRDPIWVREKKTAKKRKQAPDADGEYKLKNPRALYINDAVAEAFELYCHGKVINLDDYIFTGRNGKPMSRQNVDEKFKKIINEKLNLNVHASTHFMRKTFAYHFIMQAPDRTRAIEYLQECFNHSSPLITLRYAGITDDEIRGTCMKMNLGASSPIAIDASVICSFEYDGKTCSVLELGE